MARTSAPRLAPLPVSLPASLEELNAQIIACDKCPRLREYCTHLAQVKRRAYADCEYWGRPVPSFGDPQARVLSLGLAPGAHGSNRTGRMFTGDGSGNFFYPVLHRAGFASQPSATSRDDGMVLQDLWITAVAHCAPPGNKPTTDELASCAPWLDREMELLTELHVVVCLGRIAFDRLLAWARRAPRFKNAALPPRSHFVFSHGAEYELGDALTVIASFHPSLQNTNTGRLTPAMLLKVFRRARTLAGLS